MGAGGRAGLKGDLYEKTLNIRGLLKELLFWVRSRGKVQRNNGYY